MPGRGEQRRYKCTKCGAYAIATNPLMAAREMTRTECLHRPRVDVAKGRAMTLDELGVLE